MVFYLGLVAALALYAVSFVFKFYKVAIMVFTYDESDMILAMLGLIDAALVASLIVMVMISGYENFVSRFDEADAEVSFLGKLDSGSLRSRWHRRSWRSRPSISCRFSSTCRAIQASI